MEIFYINNHGGGFADRVDVDPGTTIQQFLDQKMPHAKAEDYLIRVNRQPSSDDQVLQPGDRVSITPVKIHGAA